MIIFNKEKYEGIAAEDNAGIVGENLVSKVEFTVNGFVGKNTIAAIHLRFKDGSVNLSLIHISEPTRRCSS